MSALNNLRASHMRLGTIKLCSSPYHYEHFKTIKISQQQGIPRCHLSLAAAATAVNDIGFFDRIWLKVAKSAPVLFVSAQLCNFHDSFGLPWWAVIVSSTVLMRFILMLPAHATTEKVKKAYLLFNQLFKTGSKSFTPPI